MGGFAQRMVQARGAPFDVVLTTDLREAVRGAEYVITQLRVGGWRRDGRTVPRQTPRPDRPGDDGRGCGMAKALRTIPVILDIASEMREAAPGALLVNFANPSGLVTEALSLRARRAGGRPV